MSDKKYRQYISTLPSCLSGRFSEYVNGMGRNVCCHVRRASNSGTGYKPEFSSVPLTQEEHDCQHRHGEMEAILRFGQGRSGLKEHTIEAAKNWFDEKVKLYLQIWMKHNEK